MANETIIVMIDLIHYSKNCHISHYSISHLLLKTKDLTYVATYVCSLETIDKP